MAVRLPERGEELAPNSEINITPFIDVMLVLLIIFMVAAPLSTVDVPVELPVASALPKERPAVPVVISLTAERALLLGRAPVTEAGLAQAVGLATKGDLSARLYISADKSVAYGEMMALMNNLRAAGYTKIGLVGLEALEAAEGVAP